MNNPDIYITTYALQKLKAYYRYQTTGEISGLGVCVLDEGQPFITDVLLFEQESNNAETELNADALAKWHYELVRSGQNPEDFRLWWHKHPIKGWSNTDEKNIDGMNNDEWLVSIVRQGDGTLLGRLDIYKPIRVTLDGLDIIEYREFDAQLEEACKEEVKAKVKAKFIQTTYPKYGTYAGSQWEPKKNIASDTTSTAPSTQPILLSTGEVLLPADVGRDTFFEDLADKDWEYQYGWDTLERLNQRYSE